MKRRWWIIAFILIILSIMTLIIFNLHKMYLEEGISSTLHISYILLIIALIIIIIISLFLIFNKQKKDNDEPMNFTSIIFKRRTFAYITIGVILVLAIGNLLLERNKQEVIESVEENLLVRLVNSEDRLLHWVEDGISYIERLSMDPELNNLIVDLLAVNDNKESLLASSELDRVRIFFDKKQAEFDNIGFFIINNDNVNIGSKRDDNICNVNLIVQTYPELIASVYEGNAYFVPTLDSDVSLSDVIGKEHEKNPPTMFFVGPIRNEVGNVIAIMTLRVNPTGNFSENLQLKTSYVTSDTYAINEDGLILSDSRFTDDLIEIGLIDSGQSSALNIIAKNPGMMITRDNIDTIDFSELSLTQLVNDVINSKGESSSKDGDASVIKGMNTYNDYRGAEVYGVGKWSDELGFGIISEIDKDEALKMFRSLQLTATLILSIMISISYFALFFVTKIGERINIAEAKARYELES